MVHSINRFDSDNLEKDNKIEERLTSLTLKQQTIIFSTFGLIAAYFLVTGKAFLALPLFMCCLLIPVLSSKEAGSMNAILISSFFKKFTNQP